MFISNAYAQATPAGGDTGLINILFIVVMFVVMYFLMIRPQMKRQKEAKAMVEAIKVGDEVITAGGLLGKITKAGEQFLSVEIAEGKDGPVEVLMQRAAVQNVLPKGTIKGV